MLSCAADACPEQQSASCEFAIDCAAEIVSVVASGDQQCDEAYIESSTRTTDAGLVKVNVIRIPAGESCKPPPCAN